MDSPQPVSDEALGRWPLRVTWALLPLLAGPAFADALAGTSRPVQVVASTGLWGVWAMVLVATLVPTTATLTAVRIVTPAALGAAVVAAIRAAADGGPSVGWQVLAISWTTVTMGAAFLPATGAAFVNGSSYGDELRLPLRVPAPLLLGPIPLAWLASVAGPVAGPLLLAGRQWVAGGLAVGLGAPAALWGVRVLHNLSRRWTVFVPAGLVLHDPLALADPVLFRRATIASLAPAPAGTAALDLTCGALGLAVQLTFTRPVALVRAGGRPAGPAETVETDALLFTPTRPGAFLTASRARRVVPSSHTSPSSPR